MLDIAMSSPRSESATAVRSGPRSRSRSRSRTPEPPRGAVSAEYAIVSSPPEYATVTASSPPGRDASQTSPAPAPSPHPPELRTRSIPWVHRARGKVLGGPNDAGNHIQGFHDVLGHDLTAGHACIRCSSGIETQHCMRGPRCLRTLSSFQFWSVGCRKRQSPIYT